MQCTIRFEWDPVKSRSNCRKHGVTFEETQSVFDDDFTRQFYDDKNSEVEDRFLLLGMRNQSRVLLACHYERAKGEAIRIISARKVTRNERKYYEGPKRSIESTTYRR